MNTPKYVIIHCSATAEGKDFKAEDINRWHKANGWRCIGYNRVIDIDGTVEQGRKDYDSGAHCIGYNSKSIGICYIGGCASDGKTPKDTRTPAQKKSMLALVKSLMVKYNIPAENVLGHRETGAKKSCPSFDVAELRELLK